MEPSAEVNEASGLDPYKIKARLSHEYYNFLDVFDRAKADKLSLYRPYNYVLEFNDGFDKSKLPKSYIYPISGYKLKQVKKYLNEYFKKGFITPSKALFAFLVLFAEKPSGGLRFYVDYRRLNKLTKRNRYSIPLINKVLARI